jgi:pyrophosphate--fructose-6-phosphate 1-phosphotransferase
LKRESGVIGQDEDQNDVFRAIEFNRIAGGKPFNIDEPWFEDLLNAIGQTKGSKLA